VARQTTTAAYTGLSRIEDPGLRETLRLALDRISGLEAQIRALDSAVLKTGSPVDAHSQRIANVANPRAPTDAVNVLTMQRYVTQSIPRSALPRRGGGGGPGGTDPDGEFPVCLPTDRLPLPDGSQTVTDVFVANPGMVGTSCQVVPGGTWDLLDAIVDALRLIDTRFAYNGKRGVIGDPSGDAIAYDYTTTGALGEGSPNVYVVDVIAGHCGANPRAAWQDVSAFGPGVWTGRGRF